MLRTLREPPKPGSLQEWALTLLLLKLEEIEQARELAFAQLLLDKGKAAETWSTYQDTARFYVRAAQSKERQATIKKLLEEVQRGALGIRPLWEKPARSRLRQPVIQSPDEAGRIYSRLGSPIIKRPR